ncbi:MAG TPA: HAD-IC family P-type ATPase [Noviherbaspirillum sp.]|nr:HAD-IC family P-type ATPase [Noviherbaspirillum sp.]
MQAGLHSGAAARVVRGPGRIRIACPRLYRSDTEKARLESSLSRCRGVTAVYASPLSGRVLILFDAPAPPDEVFALLGLGDKSESAADRDGTRRGPAPARSRRPSAAARQRERPHEIYPPWHLREIDAALRFYGSSAQTGLSPAAAAVRLKRGLNRLPQARGRSQWQILLSQFASLPVVLLGASALLSALTGGMAEALAIVAVLALNGGIGFATERRAESAIASLSELIDDVVPVLRDGRMQQVDAARIAPGDILILSPGIHVAADARLARANGLMADESALTGESMPVAKHAAALPRAAALAERSNMVYRGTAIAAGSGTALVVGTGARTEIGAIHRMMVQTAPPPTPIQRHLDQLGNRLVALSGAICAAVFAIGLLRGQGWLRMLKVSISLAIAAVPEGLPTASTTSLARGIGQMRRINVLVRRLHAVETIGSIRTICLDKTGTLTMNRMSAVEVQAGRRRFRTAAGRLHAPGDAPADLSDPDLERLLQVCVLCSEAGATPDDASSSNGSATERALLELATNAGADAAGLRARHATLLAELRGEGRNYMKTVHAIPGSRRHLVAVKGSPLEVLAMCRQWQSRGRLETLDEQLRADIARQNEQMAQRRLRVLGFAYAESDPSQLHRPDLVWLGLVGLADPLRTGVKQLIASFHRAGIRTVMATGDQGATAAAIGKDLRLNSGEELQILNAGHLELLEPETLRRLAGHVDVFARVSPAHKLQIVQALQEGGATVAMTGDGINDGPALQAADIGIAMGHGGTDLARSAADIILKDDRIDTLLAAISQGRTISANIRKSVHFLISSNLSEILLVLGGVTFGAGSPLAPLQLLWLNLLSDVLPAIALTAEPPEEDVMDRPPRDARRPMINREDLLRHAREAGLIAGGALAAHLYASARHRDAARSGSVAFNTLILGQLLHALSCRSERRLSSGLARNRQLDWALAGSIGLQLLANLVPGLRRLLGTHVPSPADLLAILAGAGLPLLMNEAAKAPPGGSATTTRPAARSRSAR